MNNEDKILGLLEQLNERMIDLEQWQTQSEKGQAAANARLDRLGARLDGIDNRLDAMQEDVERIKEDTAITRSATDSLVDWADNVSVITQVKVQVKKSQ